MTFAKRNKSKLISSCLLTSGFPSQKKRCGAGALKEIYLALKLALLLIGCELLVVSYFTSWEVYLSRR